MSKHRKGHKPAATSPAPFNPSAARGTLGQTLMRAIMADFERHGARQLRRLRRRRPTTYFKLIAALLPQEYRIREVETTALDDISDEEFSAIFNKVKELVALQGREGREYVAALEAADASLPRS